MKNIKLNNGVEMPIMGFGTYLLKDPVLCEESVSRALQAGYRLFDTAASYGSEAAIGKAIEKSSVPREELFITTKLWVQDYGDKTTESAFERSLDRLGLEYIDLYLLHQPFGDVYGAWRVMEKLYKSGRVRAIGVSNFYPDRITDLMLHNEIAPALNQIETNPFCQQIENGEFLKTVNIQHEAWSPLATGRNNIFETPLLCSLAEKYQKSVAQFVIRWLLQRNIVTIVKSTGKHIEENINVLDFEISDEDMLKMQSLNTETSVYFGKLSHRDPATVKTLGTMKFNT